jgi:hypothetical protein
MSDRLHDRLNQAADRMLQEDFLKGRGLGNEIAFYIFDYSPEEELLVRQRLVSMLADFERKRPDLRVCHIDLFALILDHLAERGFLELAIEMQHSKGDTALVNALAAPLKAENIARLIEQRACPDDKHLILLSGVGAAYPLLRSHALLNNLHPLLGATPLVLFFPGSYDGQSLRLFNRLQDDNYYRAFKLIA